MQLLHLFPKPRKAFKELTVNERKSEECEGLLRIMSSELFDPANFKGYSDQRSAYLCDAVWRRIFQSLTGESLTDCVDLFIYHEELYVQAMKDLFGGSSSFEKEVGIKINQSQGVNVEGHLIFYRNKPDLSMLAEVFHEIGHRVYPAEKQDRYTSELGANYFMVLCLEKLKTELEPRDITFPPLDFTKAASCADFYKKSLERAQDLIRKKESYNHWVTQ